jgi:regulator of cell morphogenesis and NO signaling
VSGPTSLQEALTHEHHEVDAAIEAFVASLEEGTVDEPGLQRTLTALRRHIYLEEEVVFPPVQRAGLVMPVLVMLREHGKLWRTMDRLESLVADLRGDVPAVEPARRTEVLAACRDLLSQLDGHNAKEEPIVYPHVGSDLSAAEQATLAELLESGTTPDGWTCQRAAE